MGILKAAADKLAADIGYVALKEYYGIGCEQVGCLVTRRSDDVLYINAFVLLPSPIEYIKINLGSMN